MLGPIPVVPCKKKPPLSPRRGGEQGAQRGFALLVVLVVSTLLSLFGLALTFASLTALRVSDQDVSYSQAVQIADAGVNFAREALKGQDLGQLLNVTTSMPLFFSDEVPPPPGSYPARNPISLRTARRVDFNNPPAPTSYFPQKGLLTTAYGVPFAQGRYFVKVSNNGTDPDPFLDTDSRVVVRSMGVVPNAPEEVVDSLGNTRRNSVAVVEVEVGRDLSFQVQTPLVLYGQAVNATFNGNAFEIENESEALGSYGIGTIYDGDGIGNGVGAATDLFQALSPNQYDNIEGQPGLFGPEPSIGDLTDLIRNSSNPDARNIFDLQFLHNFITMIGRYADNYYQGTTRFNGNLQLGTPEAPELTVVDGDLVATGNVEGAGLLVITGQADFRGNFEFEGIVLAIGTGVVNMVGTPDVKGGVYIARVENDGGLLQFGTPTLSVSGNPEIEFSESAIQLGISVLPLKTYSWRVVYPEMDDPEE